MTTAADDSADEIAFEAFLAGRPVPAEADGGSPVTAFAGAVRATATLPGRPNAALAELLATGLLTDQSSPSTRTAPSAGTSPRRSRVRRRRFAMFLPALLAKFLAAGAVAQAASGVGIALVAFTGAGATGMLGDDVQTTFTSVVGATQTTGEVSTPTQTPTPDETVPVETPAVVSPVVEPPAPAEARSADQAKASGPVAGQNFGDWVHEAFPGGKADGQIVSHWAHLKHVDLSEVEGIEDVEGIDDAPTATTAPTAEVQRETEHSTETSHAGSGSGGNSGNGEKSGNGGNSGNGGGHGGRGNN